MSRRGDQLVISNRKARHDYHVLDTWEAGIMLAGPEVKSIREGRANLQDSYARLDDDELWLLGLHVLPYAYSREDLDPVRKRKLLLHRKEIVEIERALAERGTTLVPLRVYFKDGRAKVEIALARGKRDYDKRQALAERDAKRETERAMKGIREQLAATLHPVTSPPIEPRARRGPQAPTDAASVLDHCRPGTHVIVPLATGEPVTLLDAMQQGADRLERVTVHQMHGLHDRPFLHGMNHGHLDYCAYFLSPVTRAAFLERTCELVPCHFSEVPRLLRRLPDPKLVVASTSPMDRHGYFSLGTNADYVAAFIGQVPFFVEANAQMPRTFGRNQLHVSQTVGWTEADYPLFELPPVEPTAVDHQIAAFIAERIPDGATIQAGIGSVPNAVFEQLRDHHDLGIHTELLSDGVIDLVERGVVTGTRKVRRPTKVVATFALGTKRLYDFLHENAAVELLPVDWVNEPRIIGTEHHFVSINATLEVDLLGQAASETLNGHYYSGSGGQADFARGAMYSEHGQGFIVLHSTTSDGTVSRIAPQLPAGSVVTTLKNTVDNIVTEYGVAELRGRSISERARALVAIAHPKFRDELTAQARELGYL